MKPSIKSFCLIVTLLSFRVMAGPISYEGGWMLSTDSQRDTVSWQLSYSVKPWLSIGADYSFENMNANEASKKYYIPRLNFLLKRWNELESQANVYLYGGLGAAHSQSSTSSAWLMGVESDWESRKIYTSAKIQLMDSKDFKKQNFAQARFGLAPYLTGFENLHSWVIMQVQYWPDLATDKLRWGPVMRFYIQNVLWELGVTSEGSWQFNTMIHF